MKIDCSTKLLEIIQNSSPLDVNLEFNGDCARYPFNVFAFDFLFSKVNKSFLSVRKKIVSNSNAKVNIDGFETRCDFYKEIFV